MEQKPETREILMLARKDASKLSLEKIADGKTA